MIVEFAAGPLRGASRLPGTPERQIERARFWLDPASAMATVHWGRNYLYRSPSLPGDPPAEVVVKQYRWSRSLGRLWVRFRKDRAARSFKIACALETAGILTPRALLWATHLEQGVSIFVSEWLEGWLELRYPLRARNDGQAAEAFPGLDFEALFLAVAQLARQLHDAGFWFRDFSVGNILLSPGWLDPAKGSPRLALVDLARCRQLRQVSTAQRFRDLARLPLRHPEDRARLLTHYLGKPPSVFERSLLRWFQISFHGRHQLKRRLREGGHRLRRLFFRRGTHAHIPPAPRDANPRDQVVWDPLSDQPHSHTSRPRRILIRLLDAPHHLRQLVAIGQALPEVWRTYRTLRSQPPVACLWPEVGVGLRPHRERRAELFAALEELGVRRVLLRLHPWEEDHEEEIGWARELASRGYELALAFPQNRALVKDRARWRQQVEALGRQLLPFARAVQIGQAVNRSKWGIWHPGEYLALTHDAVDILRDLDPHVELAGPAVIDFELLHAVGLLRQLGPFPVLDRLSTLLYVDRRGAPEARQLGFDTEEKVLFAAAVARSSPAVRLPGIWISEVNWPLREGPHSPAGRDVAVDEPTQAQYLARYLLIAGTTGHVDRVDWWQLAARGYGLLDPLPAGFRRRPAFEALRVLQQSLRGSRLVASVKGRRDLAGFAFERPDGQELWALWSPIGSALLTLPEKPLAFWDLLGRERPPRPVLQIDGSVAWLLWPRSFAERRQEVAMWSPAAPSPGR